VVPLFVRSFYPLPGPFRTSCLASVPLWLSSCSPHCTSAFCPGLSPEQSLSCTFTLHRWRAHSFFATSFFRPPVLIAGLNTCVPTNFCFLRLRPLSHETPLPALALPEAFESRVLRIYREDFYLFPLSIVPLSDVLRSLALAVFSATQPLVGLCPCFSRARDLLCEVGAGFLFFSALTDPPLLMISLRFRVLLPMVWRFASISQDR